MGFRGLCQDILKDQMNAFKAEFVYVKYRFTERESREKERASERGRERELLSDLFSEYPPGPGWAMSTAQNPTWSCYECRWCHHPLPLGMH